MSLDKETLLENRRWSQMQYDKQTQGAGGAGVGGYEECGPPFWNRDAWERFRAQYGRYPYDAINKPPDLDTAPLWVRGLCGGHLTPLERNELAQQR